MADTQQLRPQPANAVFALMEDTKFRYAVMKPAIDSDKAKLCRMTTGKYQLKGFRNIAKAPTSMLLPVLSDEANVAPDLAHSILDQWYSDQSELREIVSAKLKELEYEPTEQPFDEDGMILWQSLNAEHAQQQYDGKFLEDQDTNSVMLMSLLLGWFGAEDDEEEEEKEEE